MNVKKVLSCALALLLACAAALPVGASVADNQHVKAAEAYQVNNDTVGWLTVPGTALNDPIVQSPTDTNNSNAFYLRNNFVKNFDFSGAYFVDYRCNMSNGPQSRNTVIYGQSQTDDPDGAQLSQLKHYRDPEFAKANPQLVFSSLKQTLVWDIVAVSVVDIEIPYNNPSLPLEQYKTVLDRVQQNAIYAVDVDIKEEDRFLTLSTNDFSKAEDDPAVYRFVIVAKLAEGQTIPEPEPVPETVAEPAAAEHPTVPSINVNP